MSHLGVDERMRRNLTLQEYDAGQMMGITMPASTTCAEAQASR
jgi:hypothetical protein